jgi:hypothetical protein
VISSDISSHRMCAVVTQELGRGHCETRSVQGHGFVSHGAGARRWDRPLSGDIEMDGSARSGRDAEGHRGVLQVSQPDTATTPIAELNAAMLTASGQQSAKKRKKQEGVIDEYGRQRHKDQRQIMTMRKRSGKRGRGAVGSRVAVALAEAVEIVTPIINAFVADAESYLNTDTAGAYVKLGWETFIEHRSVTHSKELVGPNGENNNLAEELNFRFDRAEQGIYLNLEAKYLLDYAVEAAFRADTRRLPNGSQLRLAMHMALSVGTSQY